MQIVIDVPEKLTYEGFERHFTEEEKNILIKAIGNGTPLDKIRVEICKKIRFDLSNEGIVSYDDISKIFNKYKVEKDETMDC